MNTELNILQARLDRLEQDNAAIRNENAEMKAQFGQERRRFRVQIGLALVAVIGAIFVSPANRQAIAQGYGVTLAQLDARMKVVEAKTQYVSISNGDMYIKGTNLHIENGLPNPGYDPNLNMVRSPTLNGKGNLIIGYNTPFGTSAIDIRTGSHNLILGDLNRYSSFGGIVAGSANTISAPYATITGGYKNEVNGDYSSVSGGVGNIAAGKYASISGGEGNVAFGEASSVSGGEGNDAEATLSSVSGGFLNGAVGGSSSISGGLLNFAAGPYSSISGGISNFANGGYYLFGWDGAGPAWIGAGVSGDLPGGVAGH